MKKYLIALTALMVSLTLFAAPRTAEEAAALAARFTNQQPSFRHLHRAALTANDLRLVHQTNKPASTEPALYVFNKANNGGFVMVSADDNAVTILGYSDEGSFDADRMPENVRFWLDYYAERVAKAQPVNNTKKVRKSAAVTTTVSPLLDIEGIAWNQSEPYNNMCPEDAGGRCVTGCVATAAAQIMRYWKWPVQGNGSHSYSWNGITLSVNFGSATYDWDNMLPNYTGEYTEDQANAVAQLMYHAGVACNMSYSSDASSAYTENMGNGMINYFRYKSNGYHTQWYTSLSLSEINTMFIEDLLAGRPILMGGAAADRQSGHEFVCDGIDADGLFHINWGWGGSSNGFFALSALDPDQQGIGGSASGSGYSNDIDFMIGLEPDGRAAVDVTGISVAPTTLNLDIKAHEQLSFTVTPANANNRAVTWSSQDENIAIVDATGNVTGLSAGTTTITATTLDGSHSASCIVTVSSTIASAIELTVNWGYAEYDAQYVGINMPWSYIL